jgi:hypothetical protein
MTRTRRRLAKFLTSLINSQQRRERDSARHNKGFGLKQSDSTKYQFECKVIETLPLIVSFKGNVQS